MKIKLLLLLFIVFLCSCSPNIELVFVEGGEYEIGKGNDMEMMLRKYDVQSFYIGKYEITQQQWTDVMGINPSNNKACQDCPVERITWYEAIEYCNQLSKMNNLIPYYKIEKDRVDSNNLSKEDSLKWIITIDKESTGYRLPTEAEWEYAARGGNKSRSFKYSGTNEDEKLYEFANFCDIACREYWKDERQDDGYIYTSPVGSYLPNEIGIYDMSGNIYELCYDWYHWDYSDRQKVDEYGAKKGSQKVMKGGSFYEQSGMHVVYNRSRFNPLEKTMICGLRVARSREPKSQNKM